MPKESYMEKMEMLFIQKGEVMKFVEDSVSCGLIMKGLAGEVMGLGIAIGAIFLRRLNIIKRSVIFVEIGTVVEEIAP